MTKGFEHSGWTGKTGGLPWMQRSLIVLFRTVPLWLPYGMMALVVPFYMFFNRKEYRVMYCFFREKFQYSRMRSFWNVYANHFRFGQIIVDRFCIYAGKKYSFITEGQEIMDELETHTGGFIILSAHVGSHEIGGYSLKPKLKMFNALVYAGETTTVMENRKRQLLQNNIRLILIKENLSHLFELNAAIENGEVLSMPADRRLGSRKCVECNFFNETAPFPMGAFAIAAQKNMPVLAVFVMKEGYKTYHSYVYNIQNDARLPMRERMTQMAQEYADNLEEIIRRYPTQWFNYFDFWKK